MKSTDAGSHRPRVLWLVDASSRIGRKLLISAQPGNSNFQYKVALHQTLLNGRNGSTSVFQLIIR